MAILQLTSGSYHPDLLQLVLILGAGAPAFTLIGVLAAATVSWQRGMRSPAACLIGLALVVQLVGPVVIASAAGETALIGGAGAEVVRTLVLIFLVIAAAGALVAIVHGARSTGSDRPASGGPSWRVTAAGCLVAAGQMLPILWQPSIERVRSGSIDEYYLYLGLAFLAIGVVVSAVGGLRTVVAAAGIGLLIGVFSVLLAPSVEVLVEMPALAVAAGVCSLLAGGALALSPHRARIGYLGVCAVALGLLVLFLVTNSDRAYAGYRGFLLTVTPVLLVVGIVAAVSAVGAIGDALAQRWEAPAVIAGMATAFASGAAAICAYFSLNHPRGKAVIVGLLPVTAVGLIIAAALVAAVATRFRSGSSTPPAPAGPMTASEAVTTSGAVTSSDPVTAPQPMINDPAHWDRTGWE
jgi:hypothetical protein